MIALLPLVLIPATVAAWYSYRRIRADMRREQLEQRVRGIR